MAEPFSIASGALGVIDVCTRVTKYLRSVRKSAKGIDTEIEGLEHEIANFQNVYKALEHLCNVSTGNTRKAVRSPAGLEDPCNTLWARAAELVTEGKDLVERLKSLLVAVLGASSETSQRIEDYRKAIKLMSKNADYAQVRQRFSNVNMELNTMLSAINLTHNSLFRSETYNSLEQLPGKISLKLQELGLQLKSQIIDLRKAGPEAQPSIVSAKAAVTFASLNKHFYVQKPDTSIWTGRLKHLEELRHAILGSRAATDQTAQRRFVVYGIPGAGKTQFCCKFAQDYRESFWGIFWVDASSVQSAVESWKRIAKIGGREPNEDAGKDWLSNLQSPWLLIIDSADSSEESIRAQYPSGDRGCILITTRNPRLKIDATVGYLSLDRLDEDEASDLLHKATKHEPWDVSARSSASSIAKHLGYLPLALIHAGRAIYHRLCTLQGYIPFFNRTLDTFRLRRPSLFSDEKHDSGMGALIGFDIIYSGLEAQSERETSHSPVSQDAIELLNMFAFLHSNDINLDILTKAGENLQGTEVVSSTQVSDACLRRKPVLQRLREWATAIVIKFQHHPPVLPHMLRDAKTHGFEESRARRAIDLLVQISLISESSESGSYSMHPLVHVWVRKRLSTSAQALWCDAAANVLAGAIRIPPAEDRPGDQELYLRLLPHVDHVRVVGVDVEKQLGLNSQRQGMIRSLFWASQPRKPSATEIFNSAKYSRVYMECSKFNDAEQLQQRVLAYAISRVGSEHPICIQIKLALAKTLYFLARVNEGQKLQEEALDSCKTNFCDSHPQTLKVMDALGETHWQRGRLREAKALHEAAIKGMENDPSLVREHLNAISHLGRVYEWYADFSTALTHQERAAFGLTAHYTSHDHDALTAIDAVSTTLLQLGGLKSCSRALAQSRDVYNARRAKLGPEHVHTLWAACTNARAAAAVGSLTSDQALLDEAKMTLLDGIEICKRNLGPQHIGTFLGRQHYADVLVLEKRYAEAEREYLAIAEGQKSVPGARAGTHRDRIWTLRMLARCHAAQERYTDSLRVCGVIMCELDDLGAQQHPWYGQMLVVQGEMEYKSQVQGETGYKSQEQGTGEHGTTDEITTSNDWNDGTSTLCDENDETNVTNNPDDGTNTFTGMSAKHIRRSGSTSPKHMDHG